MHACNFNDVCHMSLMLLDTAYVVFFLTNYYMSLLILCFHPYVASVLSWFPSLSKTGHYTLCLLIFLITLPRIYPFAASETHLSSLKFQSSILALFHCYLLPTSYWSHLLLCLPTPWISLFLCFPQTSWIHLVKWGILLWYLYTFFVFLLEPTLLALYEFFL